MNNRVKSTLGLRLLKIGLISLVLLAGVAVFTIWKVGAWNALFPSSVHETEPPQISEELARPALLLFTKTNGFRHIEGIAGGNRLFTELAGKHGWGIYHTENGAIFNRDDLARFDVVIFNNASGDLFNEAQEQAFIEWIQSGGGWLGVHAAGDSSHLSWQWYRDNLIGASFTAHIMGPQFQVADVTVEKPDHPVTRGVSVQWAHEEEWYSWAVSPRAEGFNILATIDEDSYTPVQKIFGAERDLRMGDHPVVWSNCIGEGRSLYSAMGHRAAAFEVPEIRRILENGLLWLLRRRGSSCP